MPDLPPVGNSSLQRFLDEINKMKRGKSNERFKPHKLVMLLAVINLYERGTISANKIYFNDSLINEFKSVFLLIGRDTDWCQPAPPYFHLRSSYFWKHKITEGREANYSEIKTSGGGGKRIVENIDYAYFSDDAYQVIKNKVLRGALKNHIISIINPLYKHREVIPHQVHEQQTSLTKLPIQVNREDVMANRLPTVFHESFPLNRDAIGKIIKAIANNPKGIPDGTSLFDFFKVNTGLGNNQVKSMPKFAIGCGLLNFNYELTEFGKVALIYDPTLSLHCTQWMMHYKLSAPHGPGPEFWNNIVRFFFRIDRSFTGREVEERISETRRLKGSHLSENSVESTKGSFLNSYVKRDGFAALGFLNQIDKDRFEVVDPFPASNWVMAVSLIDYWQYQFPERKQINLDDLIDESEFAQIFMTGTRRMNRLLEILQNLGFVDLYFTSPPYGAVLLRTDTRELMEKMYENDESF
jgi:hypothetical protein